MHGGHAAVLVPLVQTADALPACSGWSAACWRTFSTWPRLHSAAVAIQALFLGASVILAALSGRPVAAGFRYALIVGLGAAMGIQNAAARKIAVPDLTTTVLTLTITGIAADSTLAGGPGSKAGSRLTAVATMLAGALIGALLVRQAQIWYPLAIALEPPP